MSRQQLDGLSLNWSPPSPIVTKSSDDSSSAILSSKSHFVEYFGSSPNTCITNAIPICFNCTVCLGQNVACYNEMVKMVNILPATHLHFSIYSRRHGRFQLLLRQLRKTYTKIVYFTNISWALCGLRWPVMACGYGSLIRIGTSTCRSANLLLASHWLC